jgi:hypothetical protein
MSVFFEPKTCPSVLAKARQKIFRHMSDSVGNVTNTIGPYLKTTLQAELPISYIIYNNQRLLALLNQQMLTPNAI